MKNRTSCEAVESLLFEVLRGEASDVQIAAVEEHLATCASCREMKATVQEMFGLAQEASAGTWVEPPDDDQALGELFDSAREADAEAWSPLDEDALFARIAAGIQAAQTSEKASEQASEDTPEAPAEPAEPRRRRPIFLFAGVAAAAAAAAAAALLFLGPGTPDREPTEPPASPSAVAQQEPPTADEPADELIADDPTGAPEVLADLQELPSELDALRLFITESTELSLNGSQGTAHLDSGTVLVEYIPGPDTPPFAVLAGDYRITVEGTVFSVSLDQGSLQTAVFDGQVRVENTATEVEVSLSSGELYEAGETRELPSQLTRRVEDHIDLGAHRRAVEIALAAYPPPETRPEAAPALTPPPAPTPPTTRDLREAALEALHAGQPREAAALLEDALARTPSTERAHADILLELARIHAHSLDDPAQSAHFLGLFLTRWSDDPAAEAVRTQLCALDSASEHCR